MYNLKKIFLLIITFALTLTLSGCFKRDRCVFNDNTLFEYSGEPVNFFDDTYIDEFSIGLTEITEDEFNSREDVNTLRNFYDSKYYEVKIIFKYTTEQEGREYSFKYLGKASDRSDGYKVMINIDNENIGIEGTVSVILHFEGVPGEGADYGDRAGRITITNVENEINGVKDNPDFNELPFLLKLIENK